MTCAEETPPYNQLLENEKQHGLFTDCSCHIIETNKKLKTAVWSLMWQVSEAIRTQGGSSQVTELKAIQLALDIAV